MSMPPPAPRPFPLAAASFAQKFLLLFGGIWAAVGVLISVIFTLVGGPIWNDWILDARGKDVEATIERTEPTNSYVNGRRVQELHLRFRDERGAEHEATAATTDDVITARPIRVVTYDPLLPARVRLKGESASFFGMFILIPLFFAVAGAVIAGVGVLGLLRVRDIYVNGAPAEAEVTKVEETSMRMNRRRVMRVHYAFDAMSGKVTGTVNTVVTPHVGQKLWVLHIPAEPHKNVAVPI